MKRYLLPAALIIVLGVVFSWQYLSAAAPVKWPKYSVTVIEHGLDDPKDIYCSVLPIAVDSKGRVVLQRNATSAGQASYLWDDGKTVDLGDLGWKQSWLDSGKGLNAFGAMTLVRAMNDRGQIVGNTKTATGATHAFLWEDGKMTDLGTLGGPSSGACGINNRGQVVGGAEDASGAMRAFVWDKAHGMKDLGIKAKKSCATAVNDNAQIIGLVDGKSGFVWQKGKFTVLEDVPLSQFLALNSRGDILARKQFGSVYIRRSGEWTELELPGFEVSGLVTGMTDSGMVVGTGTTDCSITDFVWNDGNSIQIRDLVPSDLRWNAVCEPRVSRNGRIVTKAALKGKLHIVLLTPEQ